MDNTIPVRKQSIESGSQRRDSRDVKKTDLKKGDDLTNGETAQVVDPQKNAVLEIITEFIESGDLKEALEDIKKRVDIDGTEFVKRTLIFGIEHKAYERELISQLLSGAYTIFQSREMPDGFELLLVRLLDLVLDVPDAVDVLGKFIARAVFDEILPPVFLKEAKCTNDKASMALSLAHELYEKDRKRLAHIWGPGDLSSVRRLRKEVDALLKEYLENKDIKDATFAVNSLNARSFNSQFIRQALTKALEANSPSARQDIVDLVASFHKSALVSPYDVHHGFNLTWRKIADIKLDVPNAEEMLKELTQKAKELKLLPADFSTGGK